MKLRKNLQEIITDLKTNENFKDNIVHWQVIEAKEAKHVPFPDRMNDKIKHALEKRGINGLYTHQATAFDTAVSGNSLVAVTPTASGKTFCYNLPVLQKILEDEKTRALYIFPTKALSYDQKSELNEMIHEMDAQINSYTYDGDTPSNIRQKIRQAGHIVITNPDMLHSGILPHHTKWVSLFENLKYVVIDELHIYRGVFGSHTANVIRRLKRICKFYGSDPVFVCTSATINNPKELAEELTEKK